MCVWDGVWGVSLFPFLFIGCAMIGGFGAGTCTISVPFATKLTVKLDPRCRTLDSHSLEVASAGALGGAPVSEQLAGVFGGKVIPVCGVPLLLRSSLEDCASYDWVLSKCMSHIVRLVA